MRTPRGLSQLETAAGFAWSGAAGPRVRVGPRSVSPIAALEDVLRRTARTAPLAVAYSGGRDSSLLLAVASRVCRELDADPPLAITVRFSAPSTQEHEWQRAVIRHLGLTAWEQVDLRDELDLLGPYARPQLRQLGALFPANAHAVVPMLEVAGDHCLLTGLGGDELLTRHQWAAVHDLVGRRRPPERRDPLRLAAAALPRPVRRRLRPVDTSVLLQLHWLTRRARHQLARDLTAAMEEPVRWRTAVRDTAVRADVALAAETLQQHARFRGHRAMAPFLDPAFVGALARAGGWSGWGSRTAAMEAIAGEVLPAATLGRAGKASFNEVFFANQSRTFAEEWTGDGLDPDLIDGDALRREWRSEVPDFRTASLLQIAWLADQPSALTQDCAQTARR